MSNLTPEQKLKLHDKYILSDCHFEMYRLIDYEHFGRPREEIERFIDEINNIKRTRRLDREIGYYFMLHETYYRDN